ncbi:MAG: bifunctional demethylmenaquinone methyltransferase/2-methoxy-6-polyprenyl-1,4-benzoquinol methylase UbiE [Bryobacteraceae bacterium]|nr:bifunctional demethylmenaquinone methyltransferase/2-methoxy-6-polyprenyl-1,4-benzoquinol methylase UbiE [Bryobacterales bacterium]MEB2363343.1 bifunctional demethylmenaquinone methyltransferase/2-methoxy-6-polyprenyl-1,4-benzoquinol methylase UbiE [Bryobacterales bacterium]NUM99489.1 bifunctional demethylmenaquinone methyltransferase/2-methoxy-6-polyprenyl-1,4-benzoquinol methylase UbiE [Bryobacteraceae bacterium]
MNRGTTPPGVSGEEQAASWVRGMFNRVAPRYDLLNHLLSFQMDRWWRAQTVNRLHPPLRRPNVRVLDICCGTGDLTIALANKHRGEVFGSDFSFPMLSEAARKVKRTGTRAALFEADALSLPLRDASLDVIAVAFGFRNLANYQRGLAEMRRVLKPGGVAAILEFSTPPNAVFRAFYNLYSRKILPAVGGLISGSRDAYRYLPESVRKFPGAETLARQMEEAGFDSVQFLRLTGGIVALHTGVRSATSDHSGGQLTQPVESLG